MTKSITIRDMPEHAVEELATRAAGTGRSLQEYLRTELIELAARPDPDVLLAKVRARKMATRSKLTRERILLHRNADRA